MYFTDSPVLFSPPGSSTPNLVTGSAYNIFQKAFSDRLKPNPAFPNDKKTWLAPLNFTNSFFFISSAESFDFKTFAMELSGIFPNAHYAAAWQGAMRDIYHVAITLSITQYSVIMHKPGDTEDLHPLVARRALKIVIEDRNQCMMVQNIYTDFSKWFPFFFIFHVSDYQIDNEETIAPLLPIIVFSIDGYIHTV